MGVVEGIQRFGFKRWYERALLEGHAFLVTAFLGMILAFCGIETMGPHQDASCVVLGFSALAIGTYMVVSGMRRYQRIMLVTGRLSSAATCEKCKTYAAFSLKAHAITHADNETELHRLVPEWLRVSCNKCEHEWTIAPVARALVA